MQWVRPKKKKKKKKKKILTVSLVFESKHLSCFGKKIKENGPKWFGECRFPDIWTGVS